MDKEKKIEIIAAIVIFGFFISVAMCYIYGYYQHIGYPYNTFLFIPEVKFSDFISEVQLARHLNPYSDDNGIVKAVYYPFAYIVFYLFSLFGEYALALSYILFILFFIFMAYVFVKPVDFRSYKNIFFIIFLSYPFLFELDRANIEWVVFLCTGWFFYFYHKGKENLSLIFLSVAISMKLYPLIFLTIFILDKKYMLVFKAIIMTFILTVFSLYCFSGELVDIYKNLLEGQKYFKDTYILFLYGGLAYNSTFFGLLKGAYILMANVITYNDMKLLSFIYFIFVISIYMLLIALMLRWRMRRWEMVTIITFSMILLPYVSFDYKLLFVFIPMFYYLCENKSDRLDPIMIVGFAMLLVPKNFYFLAGNISISIILNPLIMFSLIVMILWKYFQDNKVSM